MALAHADAEPASAADPAAPRFTATGQVTRVTRSNDGRFQVQAEAWSQSNAAGAGTKQRFVLGKVNTPAAACTLSDLFFSDGFE